MTPEQQALLDELAEITMRKGPCPNLDDVEPREAGCASFCMCAGTGEVLDPRLAILREVMWLECPGVGHESANCWRYLHGPERADKVLIPSCHGTRRIRNTFKAWPSGALAGALCGWMLDHIAEAAAKDFGDFIIRDLLEAESDWLNYLWVEHRDDPDGAVVPVILRAVKGEAA